MEGFDEVGNMRKNVLRHDSYTETSSRRGKWLVRVDCARLLLSEGKLYCFHRDSYVCWFGTGTRLEERMVLSSFFRIRGEYYTEAELTTYISRRHDVLLSKL
jgi:hypothetical protein